MADVAIDYLTAGFGSNVVPVSPSTPLPVTVPVQPNAIAVSQPWGNGSSFAQNAVILSIPDITPYTFFSISQTSGQTVNFQISLDGVNFFTVSMVDSTALTGDGTTVVALATGKLYTRGIKGVSAQIIAATAGTVAYAASNITLSAGVGAP